MSKPITTEDELRDLRRTCTDLRRRMRLIRDLVETAEAVITALDLEMQKPSDVERGRRVALICNTLELAKDRAKHFGLGLSLDKPAKGLEKKAEKK